MYDYEKCGALRVGRRLIFAALLAVLTLAPARTAAQEKPYLNAVKLTFLSWASGSTKISYERAFPRVAQSGEICTSLICAGYDKYKNDPLGFTLRYGHKFFVAGYDARFLPPPRGYLLPLRLYPLREGSSHSRTYGCPAGNGGLSALCPPLHCRRVGWWRLLLWYSLRNGLLPRFPNLAMVWLLQR